MKRAITYIIFLLAARAVFAQHPANPVSGNQVRGVVKTQQIAVPYASVLLQAATDSALVKGVATDTTGEFTITELPPGTYRVIIKYLGLTDYKSPVFTIDSEHRIIDLGTIQLLPADHVLDVVTIVGKRPFIEKTIDRTIMNIDNSVLAGGEDILDLLKLAPGVSVDGNDNVLLNGKAGVQFMIDNKLIYLSGDPLKSFLKSISSSSIQTIELITNPSSKYDAAGTAGIIRIRLKKEARQGFNGSIYGRYAQGMYSNFGTGFNFNYKVNKLNFFSNFDKARLVYITKANEIRRYGVESPIYFNQTSFDKTVLNNNYLKLGVDYELSPKQVVGVMIDGTFSQKFNTYHASTPVTGERTPPDSTFISDNQVKTLFKNYTVNASYKWELDTLGKALEVNYDFARFDDRQHSLYNTDFLDDQNVILRSPFNLKGYNPTTVTIHSGRLDYTHVTKTGHSFEAGEKSSLVETDNALLFDHLREGMYEPDSSRTNRFVYKENINAVYVNWSKEWKKFSLKAGLRAEHTHTTGKSLTNANLITRNYVSFFPSLFVQRTLGSQHQLNFSYSRRIQRPSYASLNPFQFYFDPYSYSKGNPYLKPEFTDSYELGYVFKDNYMLTVGYSLTKGVLSEISIQDDETKVLSYTTVNLDQQKNYNVSLSVPVSITDWWELDGNLNVYYNEFTNRFTYDNLRNQRMSYEVYASNTFTLPKNYSIQLAGSYHSPTVLGQDVFKQRGNVFIGVKKTCWDDRGTFKLRISDVFFTDKVRTTTRFANQHIDYQHYNDSRKVSLAFTYTFGKGRKFSIRERNVSNSDEKDRVE
jgi:outer membrane receptor protein involved in Fe transport